MGWSMLEVEPGHWSAWPPDVRGAASETFARWLDRRTACRRRGGRSFRGAMPCLLAVFVLQSHAVDGDRLSELSRSWLRNTLRHVPRHRRGHTVRIHRQLWFMIPQVVQKH